MPPFTPHISSMHPQTHAFALDTDANPLLEDGGGRFGVPAFDRIKPEHFRAAFARAFAAHAAEVAAVKAKHWDSIHMDAALFGRIERLHRTRDQLALSVEERRVLERYYLKFVRAGAALNAAAKARLAEINARLATLGTTFSQNVLADEQRYTLVLDGEEDLAGLPDFVRAAARATAE